MTSVGEPAPAEPGAEHGAVAVDGASDGASDGAPEGQAPPQFLPAKPDRLTRFFTGIFDRSPSWVFPLAALGCIGGAVGYTLISDPTHAAADEAPTCLLKLTTGLDCPGCGGTRAAWYLLHGDLGAAARHHILFVFLVPFLIYLYVAWAVQQSFGKKLPTLKVSPLTVAVFLAAWLVFSVLRNLPWAPFTWFYV
jgi:hypothetical protein